MFKVQEWTRNRPKWQLRNGLIGSQREKTQLGKVRPSSQLPLPPLLPRISDKHAKVAFFNRTVCQHHKRERYISAYSCYYLLASRFHALIPLLAATASTVVKPPTWSTPELSPLQQQLFWQLCLSMRVSIRRALPSFRLMARTMIV